MTGVVQVATVVMIADAVSIVPHSFEARSQKLVDAKIGGVVTDAVVAPLTGRDMSGATPSNHWNCSGDVPEIAADNAALDPFTTWLFAG